jgi:hypothetical protein
MSALTPSSKVTMIDGAGQEVSVVVIAGCTMSATS